LLAFPPFELDIIDERLWKAGKELALRRKPFAILRYLVEHPRRLVTQQELVDAVWGNVAMSDSVLRTHIRDLRRVLSEPVIETVIGRGYRFLAYVTGGAPAPVRDRTTSEPAIVGRHDELHILANVLDDVLAQRRQTVFISGDAGIGKTTLVDAFLEQLAPALTIARGACVEQYGAGEAYLPVLDALARLCRGPDRDRVVSALMRHAPTWLIQLPGVASGEMLEELHRTLRGTSPTRMLRELADALDVLSAERPFVLVLEDLHWSDTATVELIAMIGQRRELAPLLVIGTLRRSDVPKSHPLSRAIGELVSHRQAVQIGLEALSVSAVDDYVAQRFRGHGFPADFGATLHATTAGHPMFMVAMLDELERLGAVLPIDERWALTVSLAEIGSQRSESVMQLLGFQIGRLGVAEQHVLEAASITGTVLAPVAVASALEAPLVDVEAACELLADEHPYLRRLETEMCPDGSRQSRYVFTHAIYQGAAAARVSPSLERHWRRRIGECLEATYCMAPISIAAELAMHFDRAQLPVKAIAYYVMAGERALQRSSGADALHNLERANELVEQLPQGAERDAADLQVLRHLAPALFVTRMLSAPRLRATFQRAIDLAARVGAAPNLAGALLVSLYSGIMQGELRDADSSALAVLQVADRIGDPMILAHAQVALSIIAMLRGRLDEARGRLGAVLSSYDPQIYRPAIGKRESVADPYVVAYGMSVFVAWLLGCPDAAMAHARAGIAAAESIQDPFSTAGLLLNMSIVHMWRGEAAVALGVAKRALDIGMAFDFGLMTGRAHIVIQWASTRLGELPASAEDIERALSELRSWSRIETAVVVLPYIETCIQAGYRAQALAAIELSLAIAKDIDECISEPELFRLRGEIVKADDPGYARRCFMAALDLARVRNLRSFELRAAMSLARIGEPHAELQRTYDTFTEGFDTSDLVEARALLEAAASPGSTSTREPPELPPGRTELL